MSETVFFRLLDVEVRNKADALRARVAAFNGEPSSHEAAALDGNGETFTTDPDQFSAIPKSPFAYWVRSFVWELYRELPTLGEGNAVGSGPTTGKNFRFLRLWWEVPSQRLARSRSDTDQSGRWVHFAKGGAYSPFYADVHLVIDWANDGAILRDYDSCSIRNEAYYFRPGLTWPNSTTLQMSTRALPAGCIFGHMGPTAFVENNDGQDLAVLLGVMNSSVFLFLVSLQLGLATAGRKHYEVGIIKRTPLACLTDEGLRSTLSYLVQEAHDLQRTGDRGNETTHAFALPDLVRDCKSPYLRASDEILRTDLQAKAMHLEKICAEIDEMAFELYEVKQRDRRWILSEVDRPQPASARAYQSRLKERVQDLLMWCVGVAFGRWDVRTALDPSRLPPLGDPFDPLPRCAPGALVGDDGLPVPQKDLPDDYPLPIAWDGILVDDPDHPSDIVGQVQGVLDLLWGDRAGAIEREICEIIGVDHLRDYFRDYRNGFFAFHAKRYSKSRRKAPIYWLLQSEDRHYAVWLYYHRLDTGMLYAAGRGYADAKVELEQGRLETLQRGADALEGRARRRRYREIERQKGVVADVRGFRKKLDEIALLDLTFDLNDGVLLNIAPLREMVPWKYADRTWKRFQEGRYGWSSMAKQLRKAGLVERASQG